MGENSSLIWTFSVGICVRLLPLCSENKTITYYMKVKILKMIMILNKFKIVA